MAWDWQLLRCGSFRLDAGAMFGIIPKPVWQRWITADDHNRMPLQQNALLLTRPGHTVVIETGIGDKLSDKERSIYDLQDRAVHHALDERGVDTADVTSVVLTHLHFDHAGGLTRRAPDNPDDAVLTFPSAEVIVQRREWDDAIANRSTMHKTYLRNHLTDDVAQKLRAVEGAVEALPDLWVWPVPGHTWGQQAVRFTDSAGGTVCFVPDVMPTALHARPTACMAYDVESWTSQQERAKLLRQAEDDDWTLVPVHEPGEAVLRARAHPDRPGEYTLEPRNP